MKSGIRREKTPSTRRVVSSAKINLISRRVPSMLFTHPHSPTAALICPMQRVITAPIYVQCESSRNFQRLQGRHGLRFGYRLSFSLSLKWPRIFSRLSRFTSVGKFVRLFLCIRLRRAAFRNRTLIKRRFDT